jgi:antagonist of KipI
MTSLHILHAGLFTTVQDGGRPGFAAAGVSACGAADRVAWRAGNALLGNAPGAAALECTRLGPSIRFEQDTWIAWTGAPSLGHWHAQLVRAGSIVDAPPIRDGARAYLCIRGGIDVPCVLQSRSTHVPSGLGGLEGRALRAGDVLHTGEQIRASVKQQFSIDPETIPGYSHREALRIVPSVQADWFDERAHRQLVETAWIVSEQSDRMGIRLLGEQAGAQAGSSISSQVRSPASSQVSPSPASSPAASDTPGDSTPTREPIRPPARELASEGVMLGALQIPPGGQPILLFVDHQTSGGYPKIAALIQADHARAGQLHPGRKFRFAWVSLETARAALREQAAALRAIED